MGDFHRTNSEHTKECFKKFVDELYEKHKYVTWTWRIGPDRSIDQNSLLHVWARDYAAHLLSIHQKDVTEGHIEGMKRTAKSNFYSERGHSWMVVDITNFKTKETKKDFRSSRKYKRGEMFEFLTWLQMTAGNDGCVLESKGEFNKLQREQNS